MMRFSVPGGWARTTSMLTRRYDFAAVVIPSSATLPSGRVIVAGGFRASGTPITTGAVSENLNVGGTPGFQWSAIGGFAPRAQLQMVVLNVLSSNLILATGGIGPGNAAVKTAQTFDYNPTGQSWVDTTDMVTARSSHQMVTLQDGRALVAGIHPFTCLLPPSSPGDLALR